MLQGATQTLEGDILFPNESINKDAYQALAQNLNSEEMIAYRYGGDYRSYHPNSTEGPGSITGNTLERSVSLKACPLDSPLIAQHESKPLSRSQFTPDIRQKLAIEVLAKSKPISHLATEHRVSRKFLHQQGNKAKMVLAKCFESSTSDHEVVFIYRLQNLAVPAHPRVGVDLPQFLSRCR
jgi:hypothetical protein